MRGVLLLLLVLMATPLRAAEVTVFAAASLKSALDEIAVAYEAERGDRVRTSNAGSGALARQVIHGAPADVFISANQAWMDAVKDAGIGGAVEDIAANRLVLVSYDHKLDAQKGLAGVIAGRQVAVGLVDAVPAGIYAKQALQHFGLWDQMRGQLVEAQDVRAALAYVLRREVPLGVVYASDAAFAQDAHVVFRFPEHSHDPITYPAVAVSDAGAAFLAFLSGGRAQGILAKHGFQAP